MAASNEFWMISYQLAAWCGGTSGWRRVPGGTQYRSPACECSIPSRPLSLLRRWQVRRLPPWSPTLHQRHFSPTCAHKRGQSSTVSTWPLSVYEQSPSEHPEKIPKWRKSMNKPATPTWRMTVLCSTILARACAGQPPGLWWLLQLHFSWWGNSNLVLFLSR